MADALRSIDSHILILAFAFGFLALCIFLKKLAVYFACAVSWAAIVFNAGGEWDSFMRAAALIIALWAILQMRKTWKGESQT